MKAILNRLFEHKHLSMAEAKEVLINIASEKYNECEIAAFLSVYIMRSITVEELSGFRDALLEMCVGVDLSDFDIIDMCGTGGDGKNTINISTLSSFVVAGAGYKVAKHGNYGVSSGCGSSNILESLGYQFTNHSDALRADLERAGICFLHAPLFNPAMKHVAPIRKKLSVKTFFNMLGPMVNPARPNRQLIGVFSLELARLYNYIYQNSGKSFMIVHSMDGYDEISLTGQFKLVNNGVERILDPGVFGLGKYSPEQIAGGTSLTDSLNLFMTILEGKGTQAQTSVVLANSALAIKCFHQEKTCLECVEIAKESLMSGKAMQALKKLLNK